MKRRNIMFLMISLSLVLLLGSSYALLRSTKVGNNPYLINVGTLQVTFDDEQTDALALENMYPMSDKEGSSRSKELGFTVKNTGTVGSYYDITLEETSTNPEFKSVIRFISNKDNQGYNEPKTLSEDKYIDVGGYLESNASSSYKVKVWLDYNADNTYMDKTFTAKVVVNSFQESEYAKDVIKSKLVKYEESSKDTFTGGLVAVNMDGELYNETNESQEIREYRYSGPSVNNYVKLNNNNQDELWRIIGIFYDEEDKEEYIRLVRNDILSEEVLPLNYKINDVNYQIKSLNNSWSVYWNKNDSGIENNTWESSGLQYYLNTEQDENTETSNRVYMSYLSKETKSMLTNRIHYLGTVSYKIEGSSYGVTDITKEAYKNERDVNKCIDGIGPTINNTKDAVEKNVGCRVWSGNQTFWNGKISILYPSDYGYSVISNNWDKKLGNFNDGFSNSEVTITGWIYNMLKDSNRTWCWLLSPMSESKNLVPMLTTLGTINGNYVTDISERDSAGVLPVLNLSSNVKIVGGTGEESNPYTLAIN